MADRDATFNLNANDRTTAATESAADGLDKVDRKAKAAQRALDDLGDEAGQLARKMAEAKVAALALAREFDRTGDSKILKDFQKVNREAASLSKVAKSLKFDPPEVRNPDGFLGGIVRLGKKAGLLAGDAVIDSFGSVLKALPPQVQAALVVGVAAAGAFMAAAVEGAILAGAGAGAIGLAVILAAQSDKVKAQYGVLAQAIMAQLKDAGKPMEEQLLGTVPRLSAAFDREMPGIRRILKQAASDFGPVVDGAIRAIHEIMPAVERAAAVGGKILGNIFTDLPRVTAAVGHLLDAFSDSGRGANAAMHELVMSVVALVEGMALLARAAAPALNTIGRVMELMGLVPEAGGQLTTLASAQDRAALSAGMSASSYEQLSQSLGNTANMAKQLQDNFNSLFGTEMGVQQANLAVNMGMQQLNETLKHNKKTLDQSTEAGAQNAQGILNQVNLLNQKREADIKAGNGTAEATAKANAAYQAQVGALRNLLIQLGYNAGAVDALIGRLYAIPNDITTTVTTVFRTVYRTDGTPATGHSRYQDPNFTGLSGWAPAQFNADMASNQGAPSGRTQPPVQVHSESSVTVLLDGSPFRTQVRTSTKAAEARASWRQHVGKR